MALISCDANTTLNTEEDVFTLARDLGAVSALLYSLHSDGCVINPNYADPANFDQVFDIFTTKTLSVSQTVEDQFMQLGLKNETYYWYDSQTLNESQSVIEQTIASSSAIQPGM